MKDKTPAQIPLALQSDDDATFDNYITSENNAGVVQSLKWQVETANEQFIYLWGHPGSGCSHLLQASIHLAAKRGLTTLFLPLNELSQYPPAGIIEQAESAQLVCVDNVDAIVGNQAWQEALFFLFNRVRDAGNRLIITGRQPPAELTIELPDLSSRLAWGVVFYLSDLSDAEKSSALQRRASAKGLELSDDVAKYIMTRSARDIHALFKCLDDLDRASLSAQRRLTIPFVKQTFGW